MNIENVSAKFITFSGCESDEAAKWRSLVEEGCANIEKRCRVKNPDSAQTARLETLAAAYALRLYELCSVDRVKQFVAGDVRLTMDGDGQSRGEMLWNRLCADSAELIDGDGFIFRVIR